MRVVDRSSESESNGVKRRYRVQFVLEVSPLAGSPIEFPRCCKALDALGRSLPCIAIARQVLDYQVLALQGARFDRTFP
jgi:hypothetical protein